ncbi:MAG: HlyD family secretion protein [Ignavibacteriales bacterium]|nr:HlyD family secretion protein [Ignavibacteriales bacterium]
MNIFNNSKAALTWIIILVVITIILLLPIKIPYSIKSPGKILSSKEWIVSRGADGRLITVLKDNKLGVSRNYSVSQFERGDAIQFSLRPNIANGSAINFTDTVASIYSNEIERQFVQLKGELEVAKASLATYETGEKQSVIKEEKERLEFMKKQAVEQKKVFQRLEALYQKKLVSEEEYEVSKGTSELNEINISIAEAHLQSVQTGVKKEQVDFIRSQIISLQKEISILQKRFNDYILISQISGVASRAMDGDTLLIVADTTEYIVLIPVKWEDRNYIAINQKVYLKPPDSGIKQDATLIRIDKSIHQLNGGQLFLVTAQLNSKLIDLLPGLMIQCSIECDPVRPIEYLRRMFKSILG